MIRGKFEILFQLKCVPSLLRGRGGDGGGYPVAALQDGAGVGGRRRSTPNDYDALDCWSGEQTAGGSFDSRDSVS